MPDILDSFFGQSEVPEFDQGLPLGAMLRMLIGKAPLMAEANAAFNRELAPKLFETQLGVERMFDPGIAGLREATTRSIADELARGGSIPPDVMANLLQAGFERGALTGVGGSGFGRNLVARDLGLTTLDLMRDRQERAGRWTRSSPLPGQLYQPFVDITPGTGASYESARTNAQNAFNQYANQIRNQNTQNMLDRPIGMASQAAGTVLGAMFGTSGMGAGMGSMMGNMGGGSAGPQVNPNTFGGAGQPSFSTLQFAAPRGTSYYGIPLNQFYGGSG